MFLGYTSRTEESYVIEASGLSTAARLGVLLGFGVPGMFLFAVMVSLIDGEGQVLPFTGLVVCGVFVMVAAFMAGMQAVGGQLLIAQPRRIELAQAQAGLTLDVDGRSFAASEVRTVQLHAVPTGNGTTNYAVALVFDSLAVELMFESATDARAIADELAQLLGKPELVIVERDTFQAHGCAPAVILTLASFGMVGCGMAPMFMPELWVSLCACASECSPARPRFISAHAPSAARRPRNTSESSSAWSGRGPAATLVPCVAPSPSLPF